MVQLKRQHSENYKYSLVSIGIMNTQINLRVPQDLLASARAYATKHGFGNVQELIKESLREKVFEQPKLTTEEIKLVTKLIEASRKKKLYGTEEELFKKLKR